MQSALEEPVIALIGDSTFYHAGLPGIVNAIGEPVPSKAKGANLKAFDLGARTAYGRFCKEMACKQV